MVATLGWADYVVYVVFLTFSLSIGIYYACSGGRQKTTAEFLVADRNLHAVPTSLSMLVSFLSALTIMGCPADIYLYGMQIWIGYCLGFLLSIIIAERLIIPWMYPFHFTSIFDYLELRFRSKAVRSFGALLGILYAVLYMGTAMFAPSTALEVATGLPLKVSVPVMAIVCTCYTAMGGMKAVIWTDVFQAIVIIGGMLGIFITGTIYVGGLGEAFSLVTSQGRTDMWVDWTFDPTKRHAFWGFLLGWPFAWAHTIGLSQPSVQRYCSTRSIKSARVSMWLLAPGWVILLSLCCLVGVVVTAFYASIRCDPLLHGDMTSGSQILPLFAVSEFGHAPGFPGLLLALLYSGALSSVSSSLAACAANTWEDLLKHKLEKRLTDYQATMLNKVLVIIFGVIAIIVTFIVANVPGPVNQIAGIFQQSISGPTMGVYLLGGVFRTTNWVGAISGGLFGIIFNMWIAIGGATLGAYPPLPPLPVDGCPTMNSTMLMNMTSMAPSIFNQSAGNVTYPQTRHLSGIEWLYGISYEWYGLTGCFTTVAVGLLVSLITRSFVEEANMDEQLFINWRNIYNFSCYAPDATVGEEDRTPPVITPMIPAKNGAKNDPQQLDSENNQFIDSQMTVM